MIVYTPAAQRRFSLFRSPFEQALDPENRWVLMAEVVPWDEMSKVFFQHMSPDHGRASIDLRIVLGSLLVKHIEGLSDEDTIRYIQENIYAQYFVGLPGFQTAPVFVPSLFVEIRKRLGKEGAQQLNELVLKQAGRMKAIRHRARPGGKKKDKDRGTDEPGAKPGKKEKERTPPEKKKGEDSQSRIEGADKQEGSEEKAPEEKPDNKGTLIVDATVAPQHIGYPTDTRLLAEARQESEKLIDKLFYGNELWEKKPRTYRRNARRDYLAFSRQRSPGKRAIRKATGGQLRYLRRNLKHLERMIAAVLASGQSCAWEHKDWQRLWVIQELFRQQDIMYRDKRRRIEHRIVNIYQPYVRPIKRGKAGRETEFGAKLNVSQTEGFLRADQMSFDNFHEGKALQDQIEGYRELWGYYPELVLADRIYLTRENRNFMKDKGIRHTGPPLGRKPQLTKAEKEKRKREQNKRSEIEGKFGQAKSKYGLDDIKMKRQDTSFACIALILAAINVLKLGRAFYFVFLAVWRGLRKERVASSQSFLFKLFQKQNHFPLSLVFASPERRGEGDFLRKL